MSDNSSNFDPYENRDDFDSDVEREVSWADPLTEALHALDEEGYGFDEMFPDAFDDDDDPVDFDFSPAESPNVLPWVHSDDDDVDEDEIEDGIGWQHPGSPKSKRSKNM